MLNFEALLNKGRQEIKHIQDLILKSIRGSYIGTDFLNLLNILSDFLFIKSSRFIMELLQNAEDACMEIGNTNGEFRILINDKRVRIEHNGKPFDENDLRAICGIRSSKKPEKGYVGYLGIGFKSVCKVSDSPIILSGKYWFKFDKNYWSEEDVPWQILPIPVSRNEIIEETIPLEEVILGKRTIFIILFKDRECLNEVRKEVEELGPYVFMFLKHIKRIEIRDEINDKTRLIKCTEQQRRKLEKYDLIMRKILIEDITDGHEELYRFLVFSKEFNVPDYVKRDELTKKAKRDKVLKREVSIAFYLDPMERLVKPPSQVRVYMGLYSFLPLPEVITDLNFIVQADFIVQPGRETINYEAIWNKWIMQCVAELLEKIIDYFGSHLEHCREYLTIFDVKSLEKTKYRYDDLHNKLIEPILVPVLEKKLSNPLVPDLNGNPIPLSKAVKLTEEVLDFLRRGLVTEQDLKEIFNEEGLHFIEPGLDLGGRYVKTLYLKDLNNKKLIEKKVKEDKGIDFLITLYHRARGRVYDVFVLDENMNIISAKEVYFKTLPDDVKDFINKYPEAKEVLKEYKFIYPDLEEKAKDILKEFGVKEISYDELCRKVLAPKITGKQPPTRRELIIITTMLKRRNIIPDRYIWVITKSGQMKHSNEVWLLPEDIPEDFVSKELGLDILDLSHYLEIDKDKEEWLKYFKEVKVKGLNDKDMYYLATSYLIPKLKDARIENFSKYLSLLERLITKLHEQYEIYTIAESLLRIIEQKDWKIENKDELMYCTYILKKLWSKLYEGYYRERLAKSIPVLTIEGNIVSSYEAYFHSDYKPDENWLQWKDLEEFEIGPFLSNEYLKFDNDTWGWREFFSRFGVRKSSPTEVVKTFAEAYTKKKLREHGYEIIGGPGDGYDIRVRRGNEELYIEIKGRKILSDIDLTVDQSKKAIEFRNKYAVIIVFDIPNSPKTSFIRDPAGKLNFKLTIPKEKIRQYIWQSTTS